SAVPEFSVGSDALFANLLAGTVPTYGFTSRSDDCQSFGPGARGDGAVPFGGTASDTGGGTGNGGDPEGPDILLRDTVGAFEIAVLSGGTVEEVIAWLDENGYQQDPDAAPIIAEY